MSSHEDWRVPRRMARVNGRQGMTIARFLVMLTVLALVAACGSSTTTSGSAGGSQATNAAQGGGQASQTAGAAASKTTTAAPGGAQATQMAGAAPTPVPTATPVPLAKVGAGATKIVWWHISTAQKQREFWQELASTYVKDHPDVSIEITVLENEAFKSKLATAMQSGRPPDVFQSWGGGVLKQYGDAGLVQDLTSALGQNDWGSSFGQGPLSNYSFGAKSYGVPWDAGMVGFWYNKALFQKAGIATPPTTWSGLLDAVKKLKAAGITPIALGEKDKWPGAFYWEYLATRIGGKPAFDKAYSQQGSFADPPFVQAGQKLKDLVDLQPFQNGLLGASYADHQVQMANGNAAMELMGQWAPGTNSAVAQDPAVYKQNLGWFPFPAVEGGAGDPSDALGGGDGFAIGKNAPKQAIDFARFLTSVDNQTAMAKVFGQTPVVNGSQVTDTFQKEIQQRVAQAKYYQLYYDQYMPPAVGQAVNDATQGLFAGSASPDATAKNIQDVASAELKK
ncbi:MAG: ABC transporter substrate-binding protein [Chloroflexota bacterium]